MTCSLLTHNFSQSTIEPRRNVPAMFETVNCILYNARLCSRLLDDFPSLLKILNLEFTSVTRTGSVVILSAHGEGAMKDECIVLSAQSKALLY